MEPPDSFQDRYGYRPRQPSEPAIIDKAFQIDRTTYGTADLLTPLRQDEVIFWTNIDHGPRTIGRNRNQSLDQISFFRFTVGLIIVLNRLEFEPFKSF